MRLFLLLIFSFFAQADMDYICDVTLDGRDDSSEQVLKQIKGLDCKRNNILSVRLDLAVSMSSEKIDLFAGKFCRFDREILATKSTLSCVLYSPSGREYY
tara:strand:- start:662 stop:961 length:300 start_codon:yes stop_codon:yes gene_type:complete